MILLTRELLIIAIFLILKSQKVIKVTSYFRMIYGMSNINKIKLFLV